MTQPVWNTPAGSIGSFPSIVSVNFQLSATAIAPADSIAYSIISGSLPPGLVLAENGLITGSPEIVRTDRSFTFVVRATDNLQNIRDRTFLIEISGTALPRFITPAGLLTSTFDSTWIELPIEFSNPLDSNEVSIRVVQGNLPPGIEINRDGLIRGYAEPPILRINLGTLSTTAVATSSSTIVCVSTLGFSVGRPVVFSGTVFGGIEAGETYYIRTIIDETAFTISSTVGGPAVLLENAVGDMTVTLPNISVGQPTIQTYSFTLKLESALGDDLQAYSMTVVNQNTSQQNGGPGFPRNTRRPTIYNTRPPFFDVEQDATNFGYYILPPDSKGLTFSPQEFARIPRISSDNFFSFRILGHDFDGNTLEYVFSNLPLGLVGDSITGWITGTPIVANNSINEFSFSVAVRKRSNPGITTPSFNFAFKISEGIDGTIEWTTPEMLGEILNGTISNSRVEAKSDVDLEYRLVSGKLPPNLSLLSNGEISGSTSYQPDEVLHPAGTVIPFSFTIEAFSPVFPVIRSQRTFDLGVMIEYAQPTETLYIKCTPSLNDRRLLDTLLKNNTLIPDEYLYRPQDPFFGKASAVVYEHAFGIFASEFDEYVAAVTKNHFWRQLTLGELKTAIARDNDDIIYEVVYSQVIDNLVSPNGTSVSAEINWPRPINLNLGPWYTSVTDTYTSYGPVDNQPAFYTSLSPGFARLLYPNSLDNMRDRVGEELGREFNFRLLPKWMSSQQLDGTTLGYTPAWVIAYTKPGFSSIVKSNIENNWLDPLGDNYRLNEINFKIDRFTVDKSSTFNYDKGINPPTWTGLPSASPAPNPKDSKDFYVLFPRKTILPGDSGTK